MFIIYPDSSIQEREDLLRNQCVKKAMENYSHSLQQSEIDVETKNYANDGMELQKIKEEKENINKEYKAKIDNIETRMAERLERIRFGKKQVSGIIYYLANHAEKRMLGYDKFGELVTSREMLPDERQGRLFIDKPNDPVDGNESIEHDDADRSEQPVVDAEYLEVGETAGGVDNPDDERPLIVETLGKTQEQLQQENADKNTKKRRNATGKK